MSTQQLVRQTTIPGVEQFEKPHEQPTPMDMVQLALSSGAGIETIERLVALQEKMLDRQAKIEFSEAMSRVQSKIKRVAPDLENPQTRSKYASYAAIDRVIRPIYSEEGFALSFSQEDCPLADHIRIVCFVDRGHFTREYRKDMPCDGKGAKGGDVMTKTHAAGAADSYAKRYLVKDIFNVAIGEDDNDGNGSADAMGNLAEHIEYIENCRNGEELERVFRNAYSIASKLKATNAQQQLIAAKNKRKAELR